jgi:hypothetical protein
MAISNKNTNSDGKKPRNNKNNNNKSKKAHNPIQTVLHSVNDEANVDYLAMFAKLISTIPTDSNGFLTYFLNSTLIPSNFMNRQEDKRDNILKIAQIPISNLEGYPTIEFHKPIWNQLPHEPEVYFLAFRAYMQSPARSLEEALEKMPVGFTPYTLKESYVLFFWKERSKAYDLYMPVAASRLRDQRLLSLEDNHYRLSDALLQTLTEEITHRSTAQNGRPWSGLNATDIIKGLMSAAELQRTALGLPAKGPKTSEHGYVPQQNVGMDRSMKEAAESYIGASNTNSTPAQITRQKIDRLLAESPEMAEALQSAALDAIMKSRNNNVSNE